MRFHLGVIRHSPRHFAALVGCAAFIYCLVPIPLGLATRAVFDALGPGDTAGDAWTALAIVVALQLADVAGELTLGFPWSGLQQRTHALLQRNLLGAVLAGYGRHGLTDTPASAVIRFRDDPMVITSGSLDAICDLIGRALFALVAVVVMWRIEPVATIAALAPVAVTALVTDALGSRAARYGTATRAATSRISGFLGELMGAQLAVAVAGGEDRALGRLRQLSEERRRIGLRDTLFSHALNSLNFHVVHVATGAVLMLTAGSVRDGSFSVGEFALFVVFLDQLTYLPAEIGRVITSLAQTDLAIERMLALAPATPTAALVARPGLADEPGTVPDVGSLARIDVAGLTCVRPGGNGVFDVSFAVERGSFTVVTGRIGAGKSTLLRALVGLLPADGDVRWNGVVVDDRGTFFVPPRSAFLPQVPRLFSATLRDNLVLGRDVHDDDVEAALAAAVLDDDVAAFTEGTTTMVGPRGVKLSGGQVQRAAAARLFLAGAELLVIDDVSSALDPVTEAELWRRLFDRDDGATCLVVSHRPAALRRADQVLVLENGHLVG
jgi:ABC-type multidrug transport system fused ATPase/permease subunit